MKQDYESPSLKFYILEVQNVMVTSTSTESIEDNGEVNFIE